MAQETKPASTPVQNQELEEVKEELKKLGLQVAKLLSSREADQKFEVPLADEASTLLRKELAAVIQPVPPQ